MSMLKVVRPEKVVVVGTGLAGITTALQLANRGVGVIMLEKTDRLGGNSIKASSGINGVPTPHQHNDDTIDAFYSDTIKSGKGLSNAQLVLVLTQNSAKAIDWLSLDVDLTVVSKLGGHSFARTHRGSGSLPPGFAIISALSKQLELRLEVEVFKNANLNRIVVENGKVTGIEYTDGDGNNVGVRSKAVVLATGGYSADRAHLLPKYRPDLINFPLTNGQQTTGDGQKIAERDTGANLVDMDQVQVHPTGFVQLKDNETPKLLWKFLCGELIRGIGGVLLSPVTGTRFVDELSTRDKVTDAILEHCKVPPANDLGLPESSVAMIVVSADDYEKAKNHINFYVSQKLMFKGTAADMAQLMARVSTKDAAVLEESLPFTEGYFGLVTPSLHFSMGGIEINEHAQALSTLGEVIPNLYAVGEVSGGVHGGNRLGGSSLLECVVFGTVAAETISREN